MGTPITRVIGPYSIDNPGGVSVLLASPNPLRIGLLVVPVGAVASFKMYPFADPTDVGISPYSGQTHVYLHRSMYPGLIGFEWYAYTAAPLTFWMLDILDTPIIKWE